MKPDRRDVFLLLGLLGIVGGVYSEFGAGWASMAFGLIMAVFGVLGGDK